MFWIATGSFNSVTQLPADVVAVDGKRLEALYSSMSATYFLLYIHLFFLAMYHVFVEDQRERLYEYKVIKKLIYDTGSYVNVEILCYHPWYCFNTADGLFFRSMVDLGKLLCI